MSNDPILDTLVQTVKQLEGEVAAMSAEEIRAAAEVNTILASIQTPAPELASPRPQTELVSSTLPVAKPTVATRAPAPALEPAAPPPQKQAKPTQPPVAPVAAGSNGDGQSEPQGDGRIPTFEEIFGPPSASTQGGNGQADTQQVGPKLAVEEEAPVEGEDDLWGGLSVGGKDGENPFG